MIEGHSVSVGHFVAENLESRGLKMLQCLGRMPVAHLVQQVLTLIIGQVVIAEHVLTVLLLQAEAHRLKLAVQDGTQAGGMRSYSCSFVQIES